MGLRAHLSEHPYALPVFTVLAAAIPCFGFTYLWDDYYFLNHGLSFKLTDYLPNPADAFYRPLSRGVYFDFLAQLGDAGARVGHALNALFLLGVTSLFVLLARKLTSLALSPE